MRVLTWISFTCWSIWKARCAYVYQHRPISPSRTIEIGVNLALEFEEATKVLILEPSTITGDHNDTNTGRNWEAPPLGYAKINCDAAWSPPSSGGIGVVIRNHTGALIGGLSSRATCGSAAIAEAEAVQYGVNLAISLNLKKVRIESDSCEIISDLKATRNCRSWKTYPIIEQIRNSCSWFDDCSWEWVPREANCAAHTAASLAKQTVGPLRWADQPPPSLIRVLRNDGLPCPHDVGI